MYIFLVVPSYGTKNSKGKRNMDSQASALLTAEEVAVILSIPKTQIYRLAKSGEIAHVRLGRRIRFQRNQVDQFIRLNIKAAS